MDGSVGIVLPAYSPNLDRLVEYLFELDAGLEPDTVRIELDEPDSYALGRLQTVPAVVNSVPYRRGKGAAITAGFDALDTDVLIFVDADGATPVSEVVAILAAVVRGQVDVAVGSRRHPDACVPSHLTPARRYLGDVFSWIARRMLAVDLYDYQCGAKVLTREAWEGVRGHIYESGFAWDVELIAVADALGFEIAEIPIEWHDQPGSTVSPVRTSLELGRGLVGARRRARQLRQSHLREFAARQGDTQPELVGHDE